MLAIAAGAPVMSLLAMSNCSSVTAAMTTSATNDGPNATLSRSRAWRGPAARLSTTNVSPLAQAARAGDAHPREGPVYTAAGRDAGRGARAVRGEPGGRRGRAALRSRGGEAAGGRTGRVAAVLRGISRALLLWRVLLRALLLRRAPVVP